MPPTRSPGSTAAGEGPAISLAMATGIYLALSVVYFLPAFLPGSVIFGTDYLAGGFFFHHFISERFAEGELPKWVPYVYGGLPLFANPGSAFHPVHMLSDLVLPVDRVLPVVFTVHFWLAGIGTFLLARTLGCRPWIAFLVGLSYQFTGLMLSWVYAGHDGRVMVATMAPLFFYLLHGGVRGLSPKHFAGAAATLGVAMLSFQIQVAYYLILAGGIWGAFLLFHFGHHRKPARLASGVGLGLGAVAVAFLLAAVNFLPFQEYVAESPRGDEEGRGYEFSISFSMPPSDVIGFAVPEQQGASVIDPETGERMFPPYQGPNPMKLHTEYAGALVVLLLVAGFLFTRGNPLWWFFAALALFALSLALGGHTPLYRVYYEVLPGIKRFRAPDLALYVSIFSFVVMAGLTLERIASLRDRAAGTGPRGDRDAARAALARLPWVLGGVIGLAVVGLLAGLGADAAPGEPTRAGGWGRFLFFALAIGGVLWAWAGMRILPGVALVLLAVLSVADLWIVGKRFMHTTDRPAQLFAADDVVRFLRSRPEPFRVWNVPMAPYRRHDNFLMYFGIEQAGGEHGNQLQRWNEYAGAGRDVYVDWHNFLQRPVFLAAANIRYLLVGAEMEGLPWLREVHRGSALVYENLLALPRAYLVPETVTVPEGGALERMQGPDWDPRRVAYVEGEGAVEVRGSAGSGEAETVALEPDRIVVRVRTEGPAWLVLAENYHDGWEARIGDAEIEVVRTNHTFRGVAVPPGEHTVEFVFRPARLYTGLGVSATTALLLLTYGGLIALRRRRRTPTSV